ncbi:Aldo/keto reductase [Alteribacillus persepolensis]|uniref:Aldo/keto reductase n=1 Tax=Alteribacillus persepolensis TaxID=568899 RepID=A0A1G8G6X5_9BACI|nr:aldo/keto reductase [Alteribacillus persepolensis]SDH90155.1 Aldo/keto reductase [Alteribacillus persepolensis]
MSISDSVTTLANGVDMPWVGLGVYKAEAGDEVKQAVKTALESGYRSIDTASFYYNEESVGEAVKESHVAREDIFITTKVWNDEQGYEETLEAYERSCKKLGIDVIDLYLIHWPVPGKYKETWAAMEKLYEDGKVRAIGVSNFHEKHLNELMKDAKVKPMINQVEFHPQLFQKDLLAFCEQHDIQLEAWRPLGHGELLEREPVKQIAEKHQKTPAQVLIRWSLENNVVTIPKSVTPKRIRSNAEVFDFSLDTEDVKALNDMNENQRFGPHPDTFPYDQ